MTRPRLIPGRGPIKKNVPGESTGGGSTGDKLVDEVASESLLRPANIADGSLLWYGNMENNAGCWNDFTANPFVAYIDGGREESDAGVPANGDPNGEKYAFVDISGFGSGVRGMRWKSRSAITNWEGNGDGATMMNMEKCINSNLGNKGYTGTLSGSYLGNSPRTDLYYRYTVKLHSNIQNGFTETSGFKFGGLERSSQPFHGAGHVGAINWMAVRGSSPKRFYANTYWFGGVQPSINVYDGDTPHASSPSSVYNMGGQNEGGRIFPWTNSYELAMDTYFTFEEHVKLNTFTGSTPNADGVIELWLDDVLVWSKTGQILSSTAPGPANEIWRVHAQLFHGGAGTMPSQPFNVTTFGHCLATRRIGKPKPI